MTTKTPRTPTKAETRAAIAASNPLGAVNLGGNLGDDPRVPDEFRVPLPQAAADREQQVQISGSGAAPKVADADRVWIVLEDNEDIPPGGQFVGVNGVGYLLLPGVEAFVPRGVCEVLDNGVKSVPVLDPVTRRVLRWKSMKRFPYTLVNKH